jgi:hypothetical protein
MNNFISVSRHYKIAHLVVFVESWPPLIESVQNLGLEAIGGGIEIINLVANLNYFIYKYVKILEIKL